MSALIDFAASYTLAPDIVVFQRNATTIQIGTDAPRRVLIADVPPHAGTVLAHLRDTGNLAAAVDALGGDAVRWKALFQQLAAVGLLERDVQLGVYPPRLSGERLALVHRYGREAADRALAARADAVVAVEGHGLVADLIGELLDIAGIGLVHQSAGSHTAALMAPLAVDPVAQAGPAGRRSGRVRHRQPAAQSRPNVTVLAGPGRPQQGRLAELVYRLDPHLPVLVTRSRLVVGPLVLPGLSACANCLERHRLDADPDWRTVATATAPVLPPALAAQSAAVLATGQVLDLVDAQRRPATVGATLEQLSGSIHVRRRVWPMHAECRCRDVAAAPAGRQGPHL